MQGLTPKFLKLLLGPAVVLVALLLIGTAGYMMIGDGRYSLLDCFYMTMITISTIGYGEIIDLTGNPNGRVFTMAIAVSGIGILTYILSNTTAFIIEGELKEIFRRRRMEKRIQKLAGHFIVCGMDRVGHYIVTELILTKRLFVFVDTDRARIQTALESFQDQIFIEGDATDSDTLSRAGIATAAGLFAVTGDDNQNLVISLTAKQLNPDVKVVARCTDLKNMEKVKKAGADAVVSPSFIGGLRMAAEMIRPAVVSFLDVMLRDKEKNLRIEEIELPAADTGKTVSDLNLARFENILLLAIKSEDGWTYNPPGDYVIRNNDALIIMTPPDERHEMEAAFSG